MIMRTGHRIKSVAAVRCCDLYDLSDVGEQVQIAVDCSQTDAGKFFAHMHVDSVSGRMFFCACKKFLDSLPLRLYFRVAICQPPSCINL